MQTQTTNRYAGIKSLAQKYARLAVVAGALALPSYAAAETFPIEPSARNSVVATQEQTYSNALANAKAIFNRGISNRKLTLDEQRQIGKYFREAATVHKTLPKEYTDLADLLDKNLNRWHVGTPTLQEKLSEDGLHVEVEGTAAPEVSTICSGTLIGLIIGAWALLFHKMR